MLKIFPAVEVLERERRGRGRGRWDVKRYAGVFNLHR